MLYSRIADSLQEISNTPFSRRAEVAAGLLGSVSVDMLCPVVRLALGELWPRWEEREMGTGPEAVAAALAEVSLLSAPEMSRLREAEMDMGAVAQAALSRKGQNSLSSEPLAAWVVYDVLRQVSRQSGKESEQRKAALLRGLFLQATPLEGRFIARTALRSMRSGISHRTMISAISAALCCEPYRISQAFGLLPDLGLVAEAAGKGDLEAIVMQPSIPVRNMVYGRCRGMGAIGPQGSADLASPSALPDPDLPKESALLPVYPGLRVQVHKSKRDVFIFTSQLRSATSACQGLARIIEEMDAEFIIDAYLMGFQSSGSGQEQGAPSSSRICSHKEMLRYINRRRHSRKSSLSPSLLAYDIVYLNAESLCNVPYRERRRRLISLLGPPKAMPFSGISASPQWDLSEVADASGLLMQIRKEGGRALLLRDGEGSYLPGESSRKDCIMR